MVATADGLAALDRLSFEQHDIVAACRRPQSIAEIAARLRLHLNVVRVLAEDLRADGQLSVHVPERRHHPATPPYCEGLSMVSAPSPTPGGYSVTPTEPLAAPRPDRPPYGRRCRSRW